MQAQITAIEASLDGSRTNILTRVRKDFEGAERRESLLASAYEDQTHLLSGKAEETAHYSLLKRDVDATRLLYETLLQRLKEASIAARAAREQHPRRRRGRAAGDPVQAGCAAARHRRTVVRADRRRRVCGAPRARRSHAPGSGRHRVLPRRAGAGRRARSATCSKRRREKRRKRSAQLDVGGAGEERAGESRVEMISWSTEDVAAGGIVPHDADVDSLFAPATAIGRVCSC